jgi:hypothetical protein
MLLGVCYSAHSRENYHCKLQRAAKRASLRVFVALCANLSSPRVGLVNLFALRQSPGRRMAGLTSCVSQAAIAGTVISRQIRNLFRPS